MKILLVAINAKYIHSNPAVYSLKACAGSGECEVEIAEYTINQRTEEIRAGIYQAHPDVLAFSCYIWNIEYVRTLCSDLHKIMPQVPIFLGGPEVSHDVADTFQRCREADGVFVGEGEGSFRSLCHAFSLSKAQKLMKNTGHPTDRKQEILSACRQVEGLALRDAMDVSPALFDINAIPFFYSSQKEETFQNRIIYYESQRGCPYRCSYCLSSIDKMVRFRDLSRVKEELSFFLEKKVAQVKFIDRTFNCKESHSLEIWNFIRENDNKITNFHFEIAADLLTDAQIRILNAMRPGLVQLEIGVQTTNEKTLKAINRKTDLAKLWENVERLKSAGNIHLHLDLIAGLPFEDYASFQNSFNELYHKRPDELQLGFLKVLKGAPIASETEKYHILYEEKAPYEVLSTDFISYEELLKLKKVEEMLELYYNSHQFDTTIACLESFFESPYALFSKLAEFYEKKGYLIESVKRTYRYKVLEEFAETCTKADPGLVKEFLLHDLYLRENLKSRPDFAPAREIMMDWVRLFFEKEALNPVYLSNEERKEEKSDAQTNAERNVPESNAQANAERKALKSATQIKEDIKKMMYRYHLEFYPIRNCWILYDYENRNPIHYNVYTKMIPNEDFIRYIKPGMFIRGVGR